MSSTAYGLHIRRTGGVLAERAVVAGSLIRRMVGLLGHDHLARGEALVIPCCRSIHTYGMRFRIDAVFVDRRWRVVALCHELGPWRVSPIVWKATQVVELPAGTIRAAGVAVGDELVRAEVSDTFCAGKSV